MAAIRKKNRSGRSQLRQLRMPIPISSSFCFRRALFLPHRLPLFVSDFHQRTETMAPIRNENRSGKSQLRQLQKKKKKVSKQLNQAKEILEKEKAGAEEKAIILAEKRRLIELCKKENVCNERCIDLTLDILAAKDERDSARAELLEHSRSELLAKMKEEIQAFMNAGGSRE